MKKEEPNPRLLLHMEGVVKQFNGNVVLNKVDFDVETASVHVLVGENGAGKSTLMKILNGTYTADAGDIYFEGSRITHHTQKDMLELGVATIYQELSYVPELTIAENVWLGREPKNKLGAVDFQRMYQDTKAISDDMGLPFNPKTKMKELSVANAQMVEIMKAVSRNAKLIIMDEPTASISDREVQILFAQINKLRGLGIGIVYISHRLEEVFEIGDTASVLRDGSLIATAPVDQWDKQRLITTMVGRELTNVYPQKNNPIGDVVLEVSDFAAHGRFAGISFQVRAGEIVGFSGLVGAGRTEVMRALFGLDRRESGTVKLNGRPLRIRKVINAINSGILMATEDRRREGFVGCRSVSENFALPNLTEYSNRLGWLNKSYEKEKVDGIFHSLQVKVGSIRLPAQSMSGGNQQKVVIGKWMLHDMKVLILDEPTRGIDVGAKYEIYKLMCDLAAKGVAILMVSSDMPEILGMADRIYVMSEGRITGELNKQEATQDAIMSLAVK